jgi:hypothetical protein
MGGMATRTLEARAAIMPTLVAERPLSNRTEAEWEKTLSYIYLSR